MSKSCFAYSFIILSILISGSCSVQNIKKNAGRIITPNQFKGSDIQRIQSAVNAAKGTTNQVVIPSGNSNGTNIWLIDSAILIPGNINNIHAMNIMGNGVSLIQIEEAIADCTFLNGIYTGGGDQIIIYNIEKEKLNNVISENLISISK
jgi:hypothetical protein